MESINYPSASARAKSEMRIKIKNPAIAYGTKIRYKANIDILLMPEHPHADKHHR